MDVLGLMRGEQGVFEHGFICRLVDNDIARVSGLSLAEFEYARDYKAWKLTGKPEQARGMVAIQWLSDIQPI